jgi:hypothetical protein
MRIETLFNEGIQQPKMKIVIIDKEVMPNQKIAPKDILGLNLSIKSRSNYTVTWLNELDSNYKKGFVQINFGDSFSRLLYLSKGDRIKMSIIWERGLFGWITKDGFFRAYIYPIVISVIVYWSTEVAKGKLQDNHSNRTNQTTHK